MKNTLPLENSNMSTLQVIRSSPSLKTVCGQMEMALKKKK